MSEQSIVKKLRILAAYASAQKASAEKEAKRDRQGQTKER
jgi:hypothetical protein